MSISSNVSPQWLEEQYQLWKSEPGQVSSDWQAFFEGLYAGLKRRNQGIFQINNGP